MALRVSKDHIKYIRPVHVCVCVCVFSNHQSSVDPRCAKIPRGSYVETTRLNIHANFRLRRVFFMDRAYQMEDLLYALHDLCRGLRISSWIIVCVISHSIDYRIEALVRMIRFFLQYHGSMRYFIL